MSCTWNKACSKTLFTFFRRKGVPKTRQEVLQIAEIVTTVKETLKKAHISGGTIFEA